MDEENGFMNNLMEMNRIIIKMKAKNDLQIHDLERRIEELEKRLERMESEPDV